MGSGRRGVRRRAPLLVGFVGALRRSELDALFCHESQLVETGEWFREFLRERAEEGGRAAGVRYAEGFRRLAFAV